MRKRNCLTFEDFTMSTINILGEENSLDDFDIESQGLFQGMNFLDLNNIRNNTVTNEISNGIAMRSPFGKDSLFHVPEKGTLREYLTDKGLFEKSRSIFGDLDLENILIDSMSQGIDDLPYFCKKGNKIRIIQHIANTNYEEYFATYFATNSKKLTTYLDNFLWFIEGEDSNTITFHFFVSDNRIKDVICTMGSDIFDCLKLTTNINSTGGFTIKSENEGDYEVNPILQNFKGDIANRLEDFYYSNQANLKEKFSISRSKVIDALNQEFQAEGDYQRTIDWLFEKMGVTTSFKDFVNNFREDSKDVKSYRLDESRYLPFHPNFDPIFNDSLLKAFGINPNVKVDEYFKTFLIDDTEDIKKFQIQEKEVNWVYGYNAGFCGLWNALVDTVDGFVNIIPSLYDIFTDRASFKQFLHLVKEFFEHITELMDKLEEWELKNASYSVYRYEYTETYGMTLIALLFIPLPKTAAGGKASEVLSVFSKTISTFIESEVILIAYRLGLRIEKTGNNWTLLFHDIAISAGSKEKIAARLDQITKTGLVPLDEALGLGKRSIQTFERLKLQLKINPTTIDLVEINGSLFFRLNPEDISKLASFLNLTKLERRVKIKQATQNLRVNSKAKYNPAKAKSKGFDVPASKNGLSPDFTKTPYLYNENSIVKIRMTGNREKDFLVAFEKMGIKDQLEMLRIREELEYVWHHLDDLNENLECTMQLVTKESHNGTLTHIGSCGQIQKVLNVKKYK